MKIDEMIILALAGVAAWLIVRSGTAATQPTTTASGQKPLGWVTEILDLGGGSFSNGWRYFSDGTAIDPAGCYYSNGVKIWCP